MFQSSTCRLKKTQAGGEGNMDFRYNKCTNVLFLLYNNTGKNR